MNSICFLLVSYWNTVMFLSCFLQTIFVVVVFLVWWSLIHHYRPLMDVYWKYVQWISLFLVQQWHLDLLHRQDFDRWSSSRVFVYVWIFSDRSFSNYTTKKRISRRFYICYIMTIIIGESIIQWKKCFRQESLAVDLCLMFTCFRC